MFTASVLTILAHFPSDEVLLFCLSVSSSLEPSALNPEIPRIRYLFPLIFIGAIVEIRSLRPIDRNPLVLIVVGALSRQRFHSSRSFHLRSYLIAPYPPDLNNQLLLILYILILESFIVRVHAAMILGFDLLSLFSNPLIFCSVPTPCSI